MKRISPHIRTILVPLVLALMTASGCRWMTPESRVNAIDADTVDRKTLEAEYYRLLDMVSRIEREQEQRDRLLADRTIELENQREANRLLQAEIDATLVDLHYLESQFITLERQLSQEESKASAVAAMADVQLLYNKFREERRSFLSDKQWAEIDRRLRSAEEAIGGDNFTAAVYHAHRAIRMLNHSQREQQSFLASGTPRVVSVSTANYRNGPGSGFDVLGQLGRGTVVVEISMSDEWSRIRTRSGGMGWIHSSLLR